MDSFIFSFDNGKLKCNYIEKETHDIKKYNSKGAIKIINELEKHNMSNLKFSKDNIIFDCAGVKVTLKNKEDFKNNHNFSFVFEYIYKKRFKLWVNNNKQKLVAVGLSLSIATSGIVAVTLSTKSENVSDKEEVITYVDDNIKDYNKLSDGSVFSFETKKSTTNENQDEIITKAKEEITENNNNSSIKNILDIGSEITSEKYLYVVDNYYDLIEKYANMYGVNPEVICAVATQESGIHKREVSEGGGLGLMQIQASIWNGHSLTVINYETNQNETINFTTDWLRNVENNIKAGCAIFQMCLNKMNGNYYAALQCYNMGEGTMKSILNSYSLKCNKTVDEILNSNDLGWLNYRLGKKGDPNYVENVVRYCSEDLDVLNLSSTVKI